MASRSAAPVLAALLSACATGPLERPADESDTTTAAFATEAGEASFHLLLAELALERKQVVDAAREYREAARLSEDPEVAARALQLSIDVGRGDQALDVAERWVALAPGELEARRQLAALYLRANRIADATDAFDELLQRYHEEPEQAFLPLTGVLLDQPDADRALGIMERLLDRYAGVAAAHYGMALMAMQNDQLDLSGRHVRDAQQLRPDWEQAALLEARVLVASGETDAGLERAAEIARTTQDPALRLDYALLLANLDREGEARLELDLLLADHPRMVGALRAAGLLELRRGDLGTAQLHFTSLLATGRNTWEAFFYLGSIAEQRGQQVRAVRYYTQVRDGELAVPAQVRAAALLESMGEHDRAIDHLLQFAGETPKFDAELSISAGELLVRREERERALQIYNDVLARHPGHRAARFARAFLYEEMDQVDLAIDELRQLLDEAPDDPIALNALGYTLADRTGRYREAYRLIRRALELDPDNPAIVDSMGWVQYRRGKLEEAQAHLQRAYALLHDAEIAAHLAEVLWARGYAEQAGGLLEDALTEQPGNSILLEALERLGQ